MPSPGSLRLEPVVTGLQGVAWTDLPGYFVCMARTKQNPEYEIEAGGELYIWRLQRRPQESGKASERSGMAIAVRHKEGQREAVLEFPPGPQPKFGAPQLKAADTPSEIVIRGIAAALEAGWDPLSRGKKVVFVVDENGG